MTDWVTVPKRPTGKMILAYEMAMKDYLDNMTPEQKEARWGKKDTPRNRCCRLHEHEKAIIRYCAMIAAAEK